MPTAGNRPRRWWLAHPGAAAALCAAIGAAIALAGGDARPPLYGTAVDRAAPPLPLENERARTTSLAAYRGRIVVLAPQALDDLERLLGRDVFQAD